MEYRKLEKKGIEVSLLGFGCMRFPTLPNGEIDEVEAEKMMDEAIKSGVNYLDTAYPYHDGKSEAFMGKVAKKYDRSSLYYATKLPMWLINSVEDAERIFNEQLEHLQTDYVDFYLFHALDKNRWDTILKHNLIEWAEKHVAAGHIKNLGFSFHDDYETFEKILKYRDWDFCQIQYNYMDTEIQAGLKGYKLTEELGIPLVIMEPVKGGMLASMPDDITAMFKASDSEASVASWALRFVGTHPNVKVILSGMSTMEQVQDNLKTFKEFKPLDEAEKKLVNDVVAAVKARVKNGCTGCRYCMPCPAGVNIPRLFRIWNDYGMYDDKGRAKRGYFDQTKEENRADVCIECGACEAQCPQSLSIRENLKVLSQDMKALL